MQSYDGFTLIPRKHTDSFPTSMDKRLQSGQIKQKCSKLVQIIINRP